MAIHFKPCIDAASRVINIRSALLRGLNTLPVLPKHDRAMVLACYGPSLLSSLDALRQMDGDIYTVSGAHDVLIQAGIVPRGHIECDPRPHKARFLAHPHAAVTYFLASCCAPEMFDAAEGHEVVLWHSDQSDEESTAVWSVQPRAPMVLGGSTVGTRAMSVGTALGYRSFDVFGMDCSFRVEQHAGAHPNPNEHVIEVEPKGSGRKFATTTNLVLQVQDMIRQAQQTAGDCAYRLHGDGLLQYLCSTQIRLPNVRTVGAFDCQRFQFVRAA